MEECKVSSTASRLQRMKKYVYSIIFLPTIASIIVLIYYNNKWNENLMAMVEQQYYEKIEITNNILLEIERLQENCANEENASYFNDFVVKYVEEVDKQYGIYGRVLDLNGKLVSEPRVAEGEGELAILLEVEDFDFDAELGFVKDAPTGDRYIVSRNNVNVHLHWMRYPVTNDYYYYILIGIVYDRIMVSIDMDTLNTGLITMMLAVIVTMFLSAYLFGRLRKEEAKVLEAKIKCDNCVHKIKKVV